MAFLLFIAESVPSFGSILNLVGGSTITCLTFIMPPLLYIFVMDHSEIRYIPISDLNLLSERWTFMESDFYLTRLKSLSEKKSCIDYGLHSDAFACTIRFECKADQFGLGYKELTEGKVGVVCIRIRLRQCSIS